MLINNNRDTTDHVKFISYNGGYPNLRSGVLTLEIDGKQYKFGHELAAYDWKNHKYKDNNYDRFWCSGGGINKNYECTYQREWLIDVSEIPEQFQKYAAEIDAEFNDNVEWGCCGGCI